LGGKIISQKEKRSVSDLRRQGRDIGHGGGADLLIARQAWPGENGSTIVEVGICDGGRAAGVNQLLVVQLIQKKERKRSTGIDDFEESVARTIGAKRTGGGGGGGGVGGGGGAGRLWEKRITPANGERNILVQ